MTDHLAPTPEDTPLLFQPLTLRGVTLRNRVVVSPMCQYTSHDGGPTDWHQVHFGKFAVGGAGLVFGEETAIEPQGRKTYDCAGLWNDAHVAAYRRINAFIRSQGAMPGIQLGHAGGKASCHGAQLDWAALTPETARPGQPPWVGLAPSGKGAGWPRAREMDGSDIASQRALWREATLRAAQADYAVLEIHGAHGYLLHQFLSAVTNRRTDGYGGDLQGRMRFVLEVTETVRAAWPTDRPVFFRMSAVDGKGGAWTMDDSVVLARELKARGVDVVDCSSGGISGESDMPIVRRVPGYQVPFAERIRAEASIATMAVGLITQAHQAETILRNGQADLVALARELIWNPNWPAHAARELMGEQAYRLLPPEYAHRLARRDAVARLPINATGGSSSGEDDALTETT